MKIFLVGKGPGKTVTATLLGLTRVVGVYDADPYKALTELYPKAEPYREGGLISPCVVDTAMVDSAGRPYFHMLKENPDAWAAVVTSPFAHEVAATKKIVEDIREEGGVRLKGVVVSMAADKDEAKEVSEYLGISLVGWLHLSKDLEKRLAEKKPLAVGDFDGELLKRAGEIGDTLRLQERGKTEPGKKGRSLFGR